jgi:hypothetical protein
MPPVVVVVVGRTNDGVVARVVDVVVGGVEEASFEGVTERS